MCPTYIRSPSSPATVGRQLKGWIAPDLLVLDDLFLTERIADVRAEPLQSIVDQRYKLLAGSTGCAAAIARDNPALSSLIRVWLLHALRARSAGIWR